MNSSLVKLNYWIRLLTALVAIPFLTSCAHAIIIDPGSSSTTYQNALSPKKVAYVITDADKNKQVITNGGGGDKVSYFPYRDLERSIREGLRSIYSDVYSIKTTTDVETIKKDEISLIFTPVISTSTSSTSILTWPPTNFTIDITCNVVDSTGAPINSFKITGYGEAQFSEFSAARDGGLSGRRAASDISDKLRQEILKNPALK